MNNKFKSLGFVILSLILMASLLSCTKNLSLEEEISRLNIESSLESMTEEIIFTASNIQAEQDYFKDTTNEMDYDEFANLFDQSFETIVLNFGNYDKEVEEAISELKLNFNSKSDLEEILDIEEKQIKLRTLFQDLYKYHYLILENDLVLGLFTQEVESLMTFMAEGNITTIEYNTELELLMTEYNDLLVLNDEAVFDDEFLKDPSKVEETLLSLSLAKEAILDIETYTEIDQRVNEQIYNLFDHIDKSMQAVDKYNKSINEKVYISGVDLKIDDGCLAYVNEIISKN